MNKFPESEHLENEDVTEEIKSPVVSETAEESVVVNIDESVNTELPVEPAAETQAEIPEPQEILPETETISDKTDAEPLAEPDKPDELSVVDQKAIEKLDKTQLVEQLADAVQQDVTPAVKNEVEALKQAFYKLKKIETDQARETFIAENGSAEGFDVATDTEEEKLKELMAVFRKKKAILAAETEKIREENLRLKRAIVEKLKALTESNDDFHKLYTEFRTLQQQWKETKQFQIPSTAANDLWKDYQHYNEKFYDLLKINNELRDYDFKKNLELKQALIHSVEKLSDEKDIISAFYQLQKFHQEWREIGPVAKEFREETWLRFKEVSSVINKKHQEHFDSLRASEQQNLEEKTAICEEMEAIDYSKLTTFKEWEEQSKRVLALQEKWKTIAFAPKQINITIFERFRKSCDLFFQNKSDFYHNYKAMTDANLEKKQALCQQAESLKDSREWKETASKLIALQQEWKTVGPVPKKHVNAVTKRFVGACNYFFQQRNVHFSSRKKEETENLKKKKEIIMQINELDLNMPDKEAILQIREWIAEWNTIGFVPFREKEKNYNEYRQALNKHFNRLKVSESERRLQSFKSNLNEISSGEKPQSKFLDEREKLVRTYERLKSDIQTYENNLGFFSVSSKGGGGLVNEMNRKINGLKEELNLIAKKINAVDENLE
jgi:hypothetical protein